MESFNVQETRIVAMNRIEKLRRSAMSIAANDPWPFPKLRRSGMFVRRHMSMFEPSSESLHDFARSLCSLRSLAAESGRFMERRLEMARLFLRFCLKLAHPENV